MQFHRIALALLSVWIAFPSSALTIGRPTGAAWIGQPLDLVIPLALEASDAGDTLCLAAEVLQGDGRLDDRRVTVALESGADPSAARIRVRTSAAVEEPVVTVVVSAGCSARSTRRYVLLADLPDAVGTTGGTGGGSTRGAAALAGASGPDTGASFDGAGRGRTGTTDRASARSSRRPARAEADAAPSAIMPRPARPVERSRESAMASARPQRVAPVRPTAPRASVAAAVGPVDAASGAGRLQVDTLEPLRTRAAGAQAGPSGDAPIRPDVVASAAPASGVPPVEPARDDARVKALEATLAALREQTAQNQRTLIEMRVELARAHRERYRNPLVYGLLALLLLGLIALVLLWRIARRATPPHWLGVPAAGTDGGPPGSDAAAAAAGRQASASTRTSFEPFTAPAPFRESQFDDTDTNESAGALAGALPDGKAARPVNTEELFDVQQQSDFFLSLGQHDQAIAVLSEHIAENPGTSALAYLDLLKIFHELDRRDDYARLRQDFERAFNADVPTFEKFTEVGHGLEHYRSALARIESQWPETGTLQLIEELVFRKPGVHEDEAFDLAAYQELLLLYAVAKEVIDPESAPPAPVTPLSFVDTFGHEDAPTDLMRVDTRTVPLPIDDAPALPPSIYGTIDSGLGRDTALVDAPAQGASGVAAAPSPVISLDLDLDLDLDLSAFDQTSPEPFAAPARSTSATPRNDRHDGNLVDFDLFDAATEAQIAPRRLDPNRR